MNHLKTSSSNYFDNPLTESDFAQIAVDAYGSSVRDNDFESLVELGKSYHKSGEV